jgi:ABC-2 type transport system permease protein
MFLLFSMAGAMGALLEEQRTGTLERLLNSNLSMGTLLAAHWLFAALLGFAQLTVMFVWGWAVFGLDLWTVNHVVGFAVMTAFAAAAAAAFGMMLGTVCHSEGQLRGISTIVILAMSAVGGSMIPRFIMSDGMQTAGLATFNGWALDGYRKVFHVDAPVYELWPQVLVLAGMAAVFLIVARLSARRWEHN